MHDIFAKFINYGVFKIPFTYELFLPVYIAVNGKNLSFNRVKSAFPAGKALSLRPVIGVVLDQAFTFSAIRHAVASAFELKLSFDKVEQTYLPRQSPIAGPISTGIL